MSSDLASMNLSTNSNTNNSKKSVISVYTEPECFFLVSNWLDLSSSLLFLKCHTIHFPLQNANLFHLVTKTFLIPIGKGYT
jgi:hypothetical protein